MLKKIVIGVIVLLIVLAAIGSCIDQSVSKGQQAKKQTQTDPSFDPKNIVVKMVNTKTVNAATTRYFFDIRNNGATTFFGEVKITLKTKDGYDVTDNTFIFIAEPLEPSLGASRYIESFYGTDEIANFHYKATLK